MGRKAEHGTAGHGTASLRAKVFGGTAEIVGTGRVDLSGAVETGRVRGEADQLVERVPDVAQGGAGQGEYLTVREVASLLRVNAKTIYAAIRRGHLPAVRIGEAIRIPRWALEGAVLVPPPQQPSAPTHPQRGAGGKTFRHLPLP